MVGGFLAGLRDGKVLGVRTAGGRVLCPPLEYDPATGEAVADGFVELGPEGVLRAWAWVPEPMRKHPLDHPFAWALVQMEGADTALLHALDAPREAISSGMRVRVRWREERTGHITDIACFEPA